MACVASSGRRMGTYMNSKIPYYVLAGLIGASALIFQLGAVALPFYA